MSCVDFLHQAAFQFYIYAPKADPYLRRRWREPIPIATLEYLTQLSARCRSRGIFFGIGLTPFDVHLDYDRHARTALHEKVREISALGVQILAILFDDMRGDVPGLAKRQAQVISDICAWSTASRFIVCPTYYSFDPVLVREFGVPPHNYLRELSGLIDPRVDLFWTGERVISHGYSAGHLADVAAEIGRLPFVWDNHISNDSRLRSDYLYFDPSVDDWHLPRASVAGLAINPMNQSYLSRIALAGYQQLLAGSVPLEVLPAALRTLVTPHFANHLLAHHVIFQKNGRETHDARRLLDEYQVQADDPYAREIAAWLEGDHAFDPACLTA